MIQLRETEIDVLVRKWLSLFVAMSRLSRSPRDRLYRADRPPALQATFEQPLSVVAHGFAFSPFLLGPLERDNAIADITRTQAFY
jgi:hypothetical protein